MTARSIELVGMQALGLRLDREAIVCSARVREDSHVLTFRNAGREKLKTYTIHNLCQV
jgi:hypothetical protein